MNLILGLVFLLSLLFLALIFGERLSLYGILDGRWITAPFDAAAAFWDMVCELADRTWNFVFEHIWWVTAAFSGGMGLIAVAIIMVSGLSTEAQAVRSDERALVRAGSVLDNVPVLVTDSVLHTQGTSVIDDSQLVYQFPSRNRFAIPAAIRRPVAVDFEPPVFRREPVRSIVPLPRPVQQPPLNRTRLQLAMEPFLMRFGRPVQSRRRAQLVEQALLSLHHDDWITYSDALAVARRGQFNRTLREDSQRTVDELEDLVRVIPGDGLSAQTLTVEKSVPDHAGFGEFDLQIQLTNTGVESVHGVIVREQLPAAWQPVAMQPQGVYRGSTVTWLVDDILPLDQVLLVVRVRPVEAGRYQSFTEVSGTAAVSSVVQAQAELPPVSEPDPEPEFEPEPTITQRRPLPPVQKLPDVRLRMEGAPVTTPVDEWVDIIFSVTNIGDAAAEGVKLRVNLPLDLDHHDLSDLDIDRWVDSKIRRLDPGQTRRVKLTVRPLAEGSHEAMAELLLQTAQLDVRTFRIATPSGSSLPSRDRRRR